MNAPMAPSIALDEEMKRYEGKLVSAYVAMNVTVDADALSDALSNAARDLAFWSINWDASPAAIDRLKASLRITAQRTGHLDMATINARLAAAWGEGEKRCTGAVETFRPLDLSPLRAHALPAPAFPLDALGSQWGQWVEQTAASAVSPPGYVGATLLALAAALIGNARRVQPWPGWIEPSILWMALIGNPSTKKSPAIAAVLALAKGINRKLLKQSRENAERHELKLAAATAAKAEWEKQCKAASAKGVALPPCPREAITPQAPIGRAFAVKDATIEKLMAMATVSEKGLFMGLDELTALLANMSRYSNGSDRPAWLEAYGGGDHRVDRQGRALPLYVEHWSVGIVGGIQPDPFRTFLAGNGQADGLAARFLVTWPDEVARERPEPRKPWETDWAASAAERLFALPMALIATAGEEERLEPIVLPLATDARDLFESWWKGSHDAETARADGFYAAALGKMDGQCARIALALELLKWSAGPAGSPEPTTIGIEAITGAIRLLDEYFKPMARRAYGRVGQPLDISAAAELAKWIVASKPDRINASELRRGQGCPAILRDAKHMIEACALLVEAGWLRHVGVRKGSNAGRRPQDYEINPALWPAMEGQA